MIWIRIAERPCDLLMTLVEARGLKLVLWDKGRGLITIEIGTCLCLLTHHRSCFVTIQACSIIGIVAKRVSRALILIGLKHQNDFLAQDRGGILWHLSLLYLLYLYLLLSTMILL